MNHLEAIDLGVKNHHKHIDIARKIFLGYPTMAFLGQEERQYSIFQEISTYFNVPYMSVQVAGSAKTGRSFHKQRNFTPGESDLDVAVIDSQLFVKYMEIVFKTSKGYSDRSCFPTKAGKSTVDEYLAYIAKGIFRPDLMPVGKERAEWSRFFGALSGKNTDLFKSINAGVYLSQHFFEAKQRSCIKNYIDLKVV